MIISTTKSTSRQGLTSTACPRPGYPFGSGCNHACMSNWL
ncbi:hypothetical protein FOXYSP1_01724 [Fusarium oxysporum f. sp. phaseoli]